MLLNIFNLSSTPWEISMISKGASNQFIYNINETLMNIIKKSSINTYIDNNKKIFFGGVGWRTK